MKFQSNQSENEAPDGAVRLRRISKGGNREEITLSELGEVLSRRRVPLLFCVGLGIVAAILVSVLMPTRYEAVARLSIDEPSLPSGVEALAQAAGVVDPTTLQTQVSVLQTDSLAWEAIRTLRLDRRLEALPLRFAIGPSECQSGPGQAFDTIGPECRQILLEEFRKRLHVQAVPRTEILEIHYRCQSRPLAAEVVNTLATLYIERTFQMKYQSATKNSAWLADQVDGVRKDAETAAKRLVALQEETGTVGVEGGPSLTLARLTGLSQQLLIAQAERIVQEARYRTSLTGDPEALVNLAQGSTLQILHSQQAMLENQYAELNAQFGDAYPKVQQLKEQLAQSREAMKTELAHTTEKLKVEYEAAIKDEEMLRSEVEEQKRQVYNASGAGIEMTLLNRDLEASGELYLQVTKRLKSGGILAASNAPDITVIDPASAPLKHAEPHAALNLLGGVVGGLLLGLLVTVLLEGTDSRIATINAVNELCPIPGVGVIPLEENGGRADADAFWRLRTSLAHSGARELAGGAPKVILITSPRAGEGAWNTGVHLAEAFAGMSRRVLLVDADLRPTAGVRAARDSRAGIGGLIGALKGRDFRSCCVAAVNAGEFTRLPAGDPVTNAPDLLDSPRMRELAEEWRAEFDHVIVAVGNLTGPSDAAILATLADTVLLTVRVGRGRRADVATAMEVLASVGAPLHGAVVTDAPARGFLARAASWSPQPLAGHRSDLRNA